MMLCYDALSLESHEYGRSDGIDTLRRPNSLQRRFRRRIGLAPTEDHLCRSESLIRRMGNRGHLRRSRF